MIMFTALFWAATGERALKTAAQVVVAFFGADVVNAFSVDYSRVAGIALGAAVVSVLTSIISAPVGEKGTPSLVGE
jgi:ABC-type enterochelin transport system permease subunit